MPVLKREATGLPSLVWSILHFQYDAWGIAYIFVMGLVLGMARLKTGSVYVTVSMHSFVNLVAMVETALYVNGIIT